MRAQFISDLACLADAGRPVPAYVGPVHREGADHLTARVLLICDHASNAVPPELGALGLSEEDLADHIGWDIGALSLCRALTPMLQARLVHCGFSRLVADANRWPDRTGVIPEVSDGRSIPANQGMTPEAFAARIAAYHAPYHSALAAEVSGFLAACPDGLVLAVHSFTPVMKGQPRPWQAGVLWNGDAPTARRLIARLRALGVVTGDNEPYSGKFYNDTLDRHAAPHGARQVSLEVRQDLISSAAGVEAAAQLLGPALLDLCDPD
jgi:predicted N-formylglutamate amidohydrolase